MKRTSFFSRFVRIAARSLGFSSTGPDVWRRLTPSSLAMMCESVVLPSPGGPNRSTWSIASPRIRAAPMKISSCSRAFAWPTYSARPLGRSARSIASSPGEFAAPLTTRAAVPAPRADAGPGHEHHEHGIDSAGASGAAEPAPAHGPASRVAHGGDHCALSALAFALTSDAPSVAPRPPTLALLPTEGATSAPLIDPAARWA